MKKAAVLLAALALTAWATAGIDFFLTRGPAGGGVPGMKEPDTFFTGEKNFLPSYEKWQGTPARSPFLQTAGTPTVYFLWAEITRPSNIVFAQIYGLDFRGSNVSGDATLEDGLYYRHNKTAPNAYKRWDGGGKIPFPGLSAAVTARGVESPANEYDIANDVGGKTYALLAAIRLNGTLGKFQLGLGSSGVAVRMTDDQGNTRDYDGTPNNRYPDITIQGQDAYKGPYDAVTIIPEPASLLLLVLAGLAVRRR